MTGIALRVRASSVCKSSPFIEICQGTLALLYQTEKPAQDWAETQNSLGITLEDLGIRSAAEEGRKLLTEAVAAYRSALEVYTREQLPQDWAMTQTNLGLALWQQGLQSGGTQAAELLGQAVAAYRSALEVFTREQFPQQWAITQTTLSDALGSLSNQLGGKEGLKNKREAVELLRDVMSHQSDDLSRYRLASALGSLAFNLVLNCQFAEARAQCLG